MLIACFLQNPSLEHWLWKQSRMSFYTPPVHGCILNQQEYLGENEHKILFPQVTVTLNDGQSHSNWYQTVKFSGV